MTRLIKTKIDTILLISVILRLNLLKVFYFKKYLRAPYHQNNKKNNRGRKRMNIYEFNYK